MATDTFSAGDSYTWGIDLSGTLQGAGGVGGLLIEGGRYALYDANGNITQKLGTTGTLDMAVEYGPFGELVSGSMVGAYGFSTKWQDPVTGMHDYGFRWYSASLGRWLSRDPIGERGGVNLYGFVGNDGVNAWDLLGLTECDEERKKRCQQLVNSIKSSLRTQGNELRRVAELQGVDPSAYARLATDAGALTEAAVDFISNSKSTKAFDSLRGTRGLELANTATNVYAGGAAVLDVFNAYVSYVGDSSTGYQPDWGGVSYNLGSAGINALSLYLGSPGSKGIAANPWTGVIVGAGALGIGLVQEFALNRIANEAIEDALGGYESAQGRARQAFDEFDELNCYEFYGSDQIPNDRLSL